MDHGALSSAHPGGDRREMRLLRIWHNFAQGECAIAMGRIAG
jgi:hypothetical protein